MNIIKNPYKRPGIFSCRHPAHRQFDYAVSPYHLFKVAKCWPQGCVEFLWRCRLFDKGHRCPKKFKHVGRGCASCKHYYEIKECYFPESNLDSSGVRDFIAELREFEGWLEEMKDSTVRFSGTIDSVRPYLSMKIGAGEGRTRMEGYLITFRRGYIGKDLFDDRVYMRISGRFLQRWKLAAGDEIECEAIFGVDKGRIVLGNPGRIELIKNGGELSITPSNAAVGRATGKIIRGPIRYCNGCPYCSLVDIEDYSRAKLSLYRRFYCLRGITDPEHCPVRLNLLKPGRTLSRISRRF